MRSSSIRLSQAREGDEKTAAGGAASLNMLAGKGYSWKSARAKLLPTRAFAHAIRNPRFQLSFGILVILLLIWRSMGPTASEMQRYVYAYTSVVDF